MLLSARLGILKTRNTFILPSSNKGNKMKTGSIGVAVYRRPSTQENNLVMNRDKQEIFTLTCGHNKNDIPKIRIAKRIIIQILQGARTGFDS